VVCEERIKKKSQDLSRKDFWYVEEHNVEFHRLLAEATHNPVIALTMDYVLDIVLNFKKNTLQPDTRFCTETTEAHRDIFTLVRSNQPGKARAAMIDHLNEVDGYLAKVEAGKDAQSGADRPPSRVVTRKP